MLTTSKISCQGCGAELKTAAAAGQIVTCEYCGTQNAVHSGGASAVDQGGTGGMDLPPPPPPPPGYGPSNPKPGYGGSYPGAGPAMGPGPSAAKPAARGALLLGLVSALVVAGAVAFIVMQKSEVDSKRESKRDAAEEKREAARAEVERRKGELRRALDERRRARDERRGVRPREAVGDIREAALPDADAKGVAGIKDAYRFESDRPLVTDLDKDGVDDVIARVTLTTGGRGAVVALSGKDWTTLWRHNLVGRSTVRLHPGKEVVLVSTGNELKALEPKTGAERWKRSLDDRVSLVQPRKDQILVELKDGSRSALFLATGAPASNAGPRITALPRDDSRFWLSNLGREFQPPASALRRLRFEMFYCPDAKLLRGTTRTIRQGFITSRTTTYGCRAPRALAFATKAKGTRMPFLVGLGRGGKILWEQRLTAQETLETVSGTPAADLSNDRAAVAYQLGRGASYLAAVELKDGKVLWQKALAAGRGPSIRGVVIRRDRIYLRTGSELHVYEYASGKSLR